MGGDRRAIENGGERRPELFGSIRFKERKRNVHTERTGGRADEGAENGQFRPPESASVSQGVASSGKAALFEGGDIA